MTGLLQPIYCGGTLKHPPTTAGMSHLGYLITWTRILTSILTAYTITILVGGREPEALCVRPIQAMCPPRVCTTCGKPSRRIVEKLNGTGIGHRRSDAPDRGPRGTSTEAPDLAIFRTVGWTDCGHDAYRTGVVLDPFAGSGTTLAVAVGHGRDAIGIDLDSRNLELARQRLGMFLTEEAVA